VRDDIADQVQAIVKESMEEAFKKIIPEVPFVAEIRVADSWKSQDLNGFLQEADGSRRNAIRTEWFFGSRKIVKLFPDDFLCP